MMIVPQDLLAHPVIGVPYSDYRVVPAADEFLPTHLQRHHTDVLEEIIRMNNKNKIKNKMT